MVNNKLKSSTSVDLFFEETQWTNLPLINNVTITKLIITTLEHLKLDSKVTNFECTIYFVNDLTIQGYNNKYRNKNAPTNTLSFPSETKPLAGYLYAGEMFFALETITSESLDQRKNLYDHFYHLLVHSLLHLLGYDHLDDNEQNQMEKIEIKILSKLGVSNPYE